MNTKNKYERPVINKFYSGMMNKFGSQTIASPLKEIEGKRLNDLTDKFGSPLFVLSEKKIRQNQKSAIRIFKTRYPKVQFAWSYKTNYLNAVCKIFHQEGSWAEVVSEFEYEKAKLLGVRGENIIYNGPEKSRESLITAIKDRAKIHIDHFDELYDLIELTDELKLKARVAIRVNMDVGIFPKWDRFGFNFENGEAHQAIRRITAQKNLELIGLHTHIGTYITYAESYKVAASKLMNLANWIYDEYKITIDYIDMGGGFASLNTLKGQYLPAEQTVPSLDQYADAIANGLLEVRYKGEELPTLYLETGRALIDDAAYLISTVIANKRLSDGTRALIIDAGINFLFTSFWYKHKISQATEADAHTENTAIYGPLCMNIDCINEGMNFPAMKKGEKIVMEYVGAYNMTQWLQFIKMRPNIIMIMNDGSIELVRKAETLNYLLEQELLPLKLT